MQFTSTSGAGAVVSLLWPPEIPQEQRRLEVRLDPDCIRNLGLADLVTALSAGAGSRQSVEESLLQLCRDPQVIRYRQDITADLLADGALAERLAGLLPALETLARRRYRPARRNSALEEAIWRLGELESFVDCVTALAAALSSAGLHSRGLRALAAALQGITADETFQSLLQELPGLLAQVRNTASVTIGVNLDHHLQPVEATLLAINDKKFRASSLLGRLFGRPDSEWEGIAPLHAVPEQIIGDASAIPAAGAAGSGFTPMMVPLFRDLAQILERAALPVAQAAQRYSTVNGGLLDALSRELPFYLGAVRLINGLRERGLPVCRPEFAAEEERLCLVRDAYNVNLALQLGSAGPDRDLRAALVTNDIIFGAAGRVLILTGPNGGGKTTYIQAIGLVQVLAQAGLYVPGRAALISPVDGIYTHFPVEEQLERGTGRFGDEARRLHDLFGRVTRHSLVLLNEALTSTSAGESLYLAQDIVRIFRLLGVRAIFSTHLHELAARLGELNEADPGDSPIVSLVASPVSAGHAGEGEQPPGRSYKVVVGPPLGRSYAREIAERYGVSYEQLKALLAERGLLGPEADSPPSG